MNFRTELFPSTPSWQIDLTDSVLTTGSCFAQTIGGKFAQNKFPTLTSPFGTVYHPLAIHKQIQYSCFNQCPPDHTYLERDGQFFNFDFHSSFTAGSRDDLTSNIQGRISEVHNFLAGCKVIILTYGTAWTFERKERGESVANCHKIEASYFNKRLSAVEEIADSFQLVLSALSKLNPGIHVILTVSPVRHLKDTLELNQVSKSVLRVACHQIAEAHPNVDYFPSYEVMMDDLRDYRFYSDDLIHVSPVAEEYIWKKFKESYISPTANSFIERWSALQKNLTHRPFEIRSMRHQQFLRNTLAQLEELKSTADVEAEISQVREQLSRAID